MTRRPTVTNHANVKGSNSIQAQAPINTPTTKRPLFDRLLAGAAKKHARRVYAKFVADTHDPIATQDRLLKTLIQSNADSDYGKHHGFQRIRNYRDFVDRVPITRYENLAPWIERVKNGETHAMFGPGQRVHMFAMTSGTVDQPKYIPVTNRFLKDLRAGWNAFGIKALMDHPECFTRHLAQVTSPMDEQRTPADLPCGAITGLMAATQKRLVRKYYIPPLCVSRIPDSDARRYTIMRLAIPRDVSWIVTASPATVLQLAHIGYDFAERIIKDIHDGTLTCNAEVHPTVRHDLKKYTAPNPAAAKRLQNIRNTTGGLRPKDYWNLGFLANWTGGTMGLYLREYNEWFGQIPVRDIGLLATEGRMSIPIRDGTPAGVAEISGTLLEFIPADEHATSKPTVLRPHELVLGEEYYVLLSNAAGLYRYDIHDCIRVTGFHHKTPLIEFLHKGSHASSITGEKLTEHQVVLAFQRASEDHLNAVSTFVLAPRWSKPPYYQLYLEPATDNPDVWASGLADAFDGRLGDVNIEYHSKRISGRLGPVQPALLQPGALNAINRILSQRFRRSNEQFKHRYLLTTIGADDDLESRLLNPSAVSE